MPDRLRPVHVVTGRHPYEVAILAATATVGVALVLSDTRPRSVIAAMPGALQAVWEFGLLAAGVAGLAGVWWRGRLSTAFGVELCGVAVLGTVTTMYATAMFAIVGPAALTSGALVTAVAAASWWRVWQIYRDLRRVVRASGAGQMRSVPLLMEREPDR